MNQCFKCRQNFHWKAGMAWANESELNDTQPGWFAIPYAKDLNKAADWGSTI